MREIKFRYIFEDIKEDGRTLITQTWNLNDIETNDIVYDSEVLIARNQYAGLRDKNDVEIYEGDIILWYGGALKHIPIYSEVKWNREEARFSFGCKANSAYMFYNTEVVGNIYENPDLLKG